MIDERQTPARRATRWSVSTWAVLAAAVAIGLIGFLRASAAQARATSELTVRVSDTISDRSSHGHRKPVSGVARLLVPTTWAHERPTNGGTTGHLRVDLSSRCTASIELNTWAGRFTKSPSLEIESDMDYWFDIFAPIKPRPVPLVARHLSGDRVWALATPPREPSGGQMGGDPGHPEGPRTIASPFYGVIVQRLARTSMWASVSIGVRTTPTCASNLPGRSALQSALETMLRTASFRASIG